MATHRIVLLITDEMHTLKSALEILDELASSQELDPDYADEVAHVNAVYAKLVDLLDRIEQEVLAS